MKKHFFPILILLMLAIGCRQEQECIGTSVSYKVNPYINSFLGNYHFTLKLYGDTTQYFDMAVTMPSEPNYGNWVQIPWGGAGSNTIYSTTDSECVYNNNCLSAASANNYGYLSGDTLYMINTSAGNKYTYATGFGVKY